jgi:hypothetical protein
MAGCRLGRPWSQLDVCHTTLLLLVPDRDVVDCLPLRVCVLGRDGHRLPVLATGADSWPWDEGLDFLEAKIYSLWYQRPG